MTATPGREPEAPPLVSIVMPAYDAALFIGDTLASVRAQTLQSWECVVVDDGSHDDTASIVASIAADEPRIRLVRRENGGVGAARNTGLAHLSSSAVYVTFLDADDLWFPDALERLVSCLATHPGVVGAYGYAELIGPSGEVIDPGVHSALQRHRRALVGHLVRPVPELDPLTFEEWVVGGPVWPPAVALLRRDAVIAAGSFDPDLPQLEDWDLFTRMARAGEFLPIGEQVAWYRQHAEQATHRRAQFWYFHDRVRHKTWASPLNTPRQRRTATRAWRVVHARRLARCGIRLAGALSSRRWRDAAVLARGLGVLVVQAPVPHPPLARLEHVQWAGRDV